MVKGLLKWGSSTAVMSMFVASLVFTDSASAATTTVACGSLPAAIASASAGDTINVTGDCTLNTNITINKQLTISGVDEATISTNGSSQLFTVTADGAVLENFNFVKLDKTSQNLIGIQADNVSILNNTFSGQYVLGDGEVTRALVVSPGVMDVTLSDNVFESLRQPAYINDNATGVVSNNYVDQTRGFVVVANSSLEFSGNSWGVNAVDIAIIPGVPNNYTCEVLRQIIRDNNNANVENQAQTTPCPTYPNTKDECKDGGYKAFTGVVFKNQGQCVSYVASGNKSAAIS